MHTRQCQKEDLWNHIVRYRCDDQNSFKEEDFSDLHMSDSDVYVYVYTIVPTAIFITVLVVVAFCCYRRQKLKNKSDTDKDVKSSSDTKETDFLDSTELSNRRGVDKDIYLKLSDNQKFGFSIVGGGSFEGVYVHEIFSDSPNSESKLRKGDQIVQIGDKDTSRWEKQEVIRGLKESGKRVYITTRNKFKEYIKFLPRIGNTVKEMQTSDGKPSKPVKKAVNTGTITIEWEKPVGMRKDDIACYEIQYKPYGGHASTVKTIRTPDNSETYEVRDLKTNTEYVFRVGIIRTNEDEDEDDRPPLRSPYSNTIATEMTLANLIVDDNSYFPRKEEKTDKEITCWKLPVNIVEESVDQEAMTRRCILDTNRHDGSKPSKTIMIVGATGTGKSTLIDGMINYIFDVRWEDNFRFKLIDLTEIEREKCLEQDKSQTEWITCYTIKRMKRSKIDYDLNIIDTPGFGDTRGPERDDKIRVQIERLFKETNRAGIQTVDAVCFVVTPQPRLNAPQKYIFDRVLSMFGKDIEHNIFMLVTYADAAEPPVLAALKEDNIQYEGYFKFNNSALFVSNEKPGDDDLHNKRTEWQGHKLNWKMGMNSFQTFFEAIQTFTPRSLEMTSEVLEAQIKIKSVVQGLQHYIVRLVNDMQTLKGTCKSIDIHKEDIEQNKDFEYTVEETEIEEESIPSKFMHMATNCLTCRNTCCYPCIGFKIFGYDPFKVFCSGFKIFKMSFECEVCGHKLSEHERSGEKKFVGRTVTKTRTYEEMKARFNIASDKAQNANAVKANVENELKKLGRDALLKVKQIKDLTNELRDKALRPTPLTNIDYLNLLIDNEMSNCKPGWSNRITAYRKMIKESELLELAMDPEKKHSPFENIDDFLNDMREEIDPDVPMEV